MKNINSFVVNNEARQEDFECKCMQQEEALTRLNEEAVNNVNLNATVNRVTGMNQNLRESHNSFITMVAHREYELDKQIFQLEKALERAVEAKWEIKEDHDIIVENLKKEINFERILNTGTMSANDALHNRIQSVKKEHANTKRVTTRKINKLEKKIKDMQSQETTGIIKRGSVIKSFAKINRRPATFVVPRI